ncbi:MAG TPA: hypothetical protein VH087_11850 [Thermoanaerobaculia bacterium]|nr:hypothetical protein [Thermoanaerobaculia bacterium]
MNNRIRILGWVVLIGVAINIIGMAIPFIFAPQWYLDKFGLPGEGGSIVWMRQAGLLLLYISILYVPGGFDPVRYRMNAVFAILVRFTIGCYWLYLVFAEGRTRSFIKFGLMDTIYAAVNAIVMMWWAMRPAPRD